MLSTEAPNTQHPELDRYDTERLVRAFADDQLNAVQAVQRATPQLAAAVEAAVPRIRAGGRLLYFGAGTSGRKAVACQIGFCGRGEWATSPG